MTGAAKYPPKLNSSWLMDDDAAWCSLPAVLIMTPVAMGIMAAPKKSKHHNNGMIYTKLFRNPMGAAKTKAMVPNAAHILIALITFLPLYPPFLSDKYPPIAAPGIGAVILQSE